jgi:TPR repeat protein
MTNIIRVQRVIVIASVLGLVFCLVPVRSISAQDRTAPAFLLQRGDALLQLGDVSAARLLYTRAAELGSGTAAMELAKTYDPTFLTDHNLRGVKPDLAEATRWYQRAADMGLTQAKERLRNMSMNAVAQKR